MQKRVRDLPDWLGGVRRELPEIGLEKPGALEGQAELGLFSAGNEEPLNGFKQLLARSDLCV